MHLAGFIIKKQTNKQTQLGKRRCLRRKTKVMYDKALT